MEPRRAAMLDSGYVWIVDGPTQNLTEHQHRDVLTAGRVRGRGAGLNPANRFEDVRLHVLGEHLDEVRLEQMNEGLDPDQGVSVQTRVYRDCSRSVLNHVESPDIGFSWTVNPYRGCEHGCVYCYARPGHEYLGWSSGLDFETKIMAKLDAARLLRQELDKPAWAGESIMISGVTDPYQPVERSLRITRSVLELCREYAQPVTVITKNALVERDADVLSELAEHGAAGAAISITTLDNQLASRLEPRASAPAARLRAVRTLADAGVPVSVMVAPIIPGINDTEIAAILRSAAEAGASNAGYVMLRLPYQNKDLFLEWLRRHFPDRAAKVEAMVRTLHGGELYDHRWFKRQRGEGVMAEQIERVFEVFKKRAGLGERRGREARSGRAAEFLRRRVERERKGQGVLFE